MTENDASCSDIHSCQRTQINATHISEIKCSDDESCADTRDRWYIKCVDESPDDACEMHCDGDRACGYTLDGGLNTTITNRYSEYSVKNIKHLDCSHSEACHRGDFELAPPKCGRGNDASNLDSTELCCTDEDKQSTEEGCYLDIDCSESNACEYAKIHAHHTKDVECDNNACVNSNMTFIDPHPEFKLDCAGMTGNISSFAITI